MPASAKHPITHHRDRPNTLFTNQIRKPEIDDAGAEQDRTVARRISSGPGVVWSVPIARSSRSHVKITMCPLAAQMPSRPPLNPRQECEDLLRGLLDFGHLSYTRHMFGAFHNATNADNSVLGPPRPDKTRIDPIALTKRIKPSCRGHPPAIARIRGSPLHSRTLRLAPCPPRRLPPSRGAPKIAASSLHIERADPAASFLKATARPIVGALSMRNLERRDGSPIQTRTKF
jgi:hypothetical protein